MARHRRKGGRKSHRKHRGRGAKLKKAKAFFDRVLKSDLAGSVLNYLGDRRSKL
jgi:hypothetical protein